MPRRCNDLCKHLPHIRSLRWVTSKKQYKYCSKCGVYFRAPLSQIVCECCKDTLRVYYRLANIPRRRERFRRKLFRLLNQSHLLLRRIVESETHGWAPRSQINKKYWDKNRDKINARRREKYLQRKSSIYLRHTTIDPQIDATIKQSLSSSLINGEVNSTVISVRNL